MQCLRNCIKSSFSVRSILSARKISSSGAIFKDVPGYDDLIHPEGNEPGIPKYIEKEGENVEQKKSRLIYQSRKRGMLENGLLLSTFAKKYIDKFTEDQLRQYDRLINLPSNDWDIFYWAAEVKPTPQEFDNEIMNLLKKHVRNENKETRYRQPDLY